MRRASDRDLVAHYRDDLLRRGVKAPSLDDLMYQYAEFLHFGFKVNAIEKTSQAYADAYLDPASPIAVASSRESRAARLFPRPLSCRGATPGADAGRTEQDVPPA